MAASRQRPKLIAIVGPTASGKSELALKVAKQFAGEIITADARTIFKDADIGTAKPTKASQKAVAHWGIDLIKPGESYSAKQFKDYTEQKIKEIRARDHLPILVGGTGLYVDSVIFNFSFRPAGELGLRTALEAKTIPQLQDMISELGYRLPANSRNKRYLIRTIEAKGLAGQGRSKPLSGTILIGLLPSSNELKERINKRVERFFKRGIKTETQALVNKYGLSAAASAGIAYSVCTRILTGELNSQEAKEQVKVKEWQYARRQKTWFKRNRFIEWFKDADIAEEYIRNLLNT